MACVNCQPCAVCCMVCPPPILAPTRPEPVKPLALPCPANQCNNGTLLSPGEAERFRYDNFYNNYNVDWRAQPEDEDMQACRQRMNAKSHGVNYDGQKCRHQEIDVCKNRTIEERSCPTGFKICTMKLTPPEGCHPCDVWCAQIQPCPPKRKSKNNVYQPPMPCTRPDCRHWKPPDGECKYELPCKAHCFDVESPKKKKGAKAC